MTTFFLFGKYTRDSASGIDARRTKRAEEIVNGFGGTLRSVYALLGSTDIVFIVELPGIPEALQVSIGIGKVTGIDLTTSPAIPVAEFDRLAEIALRS